MIQRILSMIAAWCSNPIAAWMMHALLYGTLLALATWLIVRLFRNRLPSSIQAILWCIVLIKFIVPMGPQWSLSLASLFESAWQSNSIRKVSNESLATEFVGLELNLDDAFVSGAAPTSSAGIGWSTILFGCYGAIVLFVMLRGLIAYRRLRKNCTSLPAADASVNERIRTACKQLNVRRIPSVFVTTEANAPFVLGGWQPILVLSHRHLGDTNLLDTVVVHEVAHLRRGDFVVRYIQWIAGSLLFYWPVVTWVNRQIDLARENACDEWALKMGKLSAADYARCLLDAVTHHSNQFATLRPEAFQTAAYHPACMAANPAIIERRIDMILKSQNMRKGSAWLAAASVMVAAWGSFTLAGSANSEQDQIDEQTPIVERVELEVIEESDAETSRQLLIETKYKTEQWFAEVRDRVKAIPAADTDGDGNVSNQEITYYLATKALADPEGVIEAHGFADMNRDGELSVEEALYFASGKRPRQATRSGKVIEEKASGGTLAVSVTGEVATTGEVSNGELVIRRVVKENASNRMLEMHSVAGRRLWVLNNVAIEPTADELAEAAAVFEEHIAERYLAAYPEADFDGDGELTIEERKSHQEMVALRELLERFPDADLNDDGEVTADERDEFKSSQHSSDWKRLKELEMIERARAGR